MEIWVNIHTYNTYGGHSSLSLVGEFFRMDLPDLGEAVRELDINVYFRSDKGPQKRLESLYKQYHDFIEGLPSSRFFRKKGKIEINFLSRLGSSDIVSGYGPPKLELFRKGAHEIAGELSVIKKKIKESDDFQVDSFLDIIREKLKSLPRTLEEFEDLKTRVEEFSKKRIESMDEWEKLGIDWDDFHPKAREILDEPFFWDCTDDFSPNGNDTGADVLAFYQEWRKQNKKRPAATFFDRLMRDWDVVIPPPPGDEFSVMTFHESIVGLAFSQLKVDGFCETQIRDQALTSISRHRERIKKFHNDWELFEERMKTLDLIESKLKEL